MRLTQQQVSDQLKNFQQFSNTNLSKYGKTIVTLLKHDNIYIYKYIAAVLRHNKIIHCCYNPLELNKGNNLFYSECFKIKALNDYINSIQIQ